MNPQYKSLSLYDFCEIVSLFLSAELVDEKSKIKLLECSSLFSPNTEVSCIGFECPLNGSDQWCDFHFELFLTNEILSALQHSFSDRIWVQNCSWEKISTFFNNWSKSGFVNETNVAPRVGLEFDIGSSPAIWPPKPNLFFELGNDENTYQQIHDAFYWSNGNRLSEKSSGIVQKCTTNNLTITYAGFMLGRSLNAIRLVCRSKEKSGIDEMFAYLDNINHPCLDDNLISLVNKVSPFVTTISFELDIGEYPMPKLGINCLVKKDNFVATKNQWEHFLAFLCAEKLITNANKNALLTWIGGKSELISSLDLNSLNSETLDAINVVRDINHIKFNYIPEKKLQTKAYLRAVGVSPSLFTLN